MKFSLETVATVRQCLMHCLTLCLLMRIIYLYCLHWRITGREMCVREKENKAYACVSNAADMFIRARCVRASCETGIFIFSIRDVKEKRRGKYVSSVLFCSHLSSKPQSTKHSRRVQSKLLQAKNGSI